MKNDIVRAKCGDMSVDGQGICKADGLVIFVKGIIVDEIADVKIISEKKNLCYGIIDKLIEKSPYRRESECRISYKCGGCDWRYIDYDYQLVLKKKTLENTFRGLDVIVSDVVKSADPFHYRNKVQVPFRNHLLGFYRKYSNDIVEFDDCYIESKEANDIILDLRKLLVDKKIDGYFRHILIKHAFGSNEIMLGFIVRDLAVPHIEEITADLVKKYPNIKSIILNLNTRDDNVILGTDEKVIFGKDHIMDIYDGIKAKISLKSFYQVNHEMMVKLYSKIKDLANINEEDEVLDLYCGIGTIGMFLCRYCKHVTGVEIVESAIVNAKENAKINGFSNIDFVLGDASKNMSEYLRNKDVVVVDPPRKGLGSKLVNELLASDVKKIVYVSCNPATLARDLDLLKEEYSFDTIYPYDMFPYTTHVESVCLLTKVKTRDKSTR